MTGPLRLGLLAAAAALVAAPAWATRPYRRAVPLAELPAWVRAAASTPTPDTDADFVVLLDEKRVQPLAAGGVRVVQRRAVRPLKITAVEKIWDFALEYRKADRGPEIRSWTVAPDGASATRPDDVLDRRDDPRSESGVLVDDARLLSISAANPIVGATVAYETTVVKDLDLGAEPMGFGREYHPVVRSLLTLEVPEGWGADASTSGMREVPCARTATTITCEAVDIPALPRDEARPIAADLLSRVWVRWWSKDGTRGFADWDAAARWQWDLAQPVLADVGEVEQVADRLRPAGPDDLEAAIDRLFAWVARDVRYVAIDIGIGGYRPHPPALVASRRYGDCKDKAFVLRAVLARWGLNTYFVGIRTRDRGLVDPNVPTPGQFNHMIAAVALPDGVLADRWPVVSVEGVGRLLLLDGTARESDAWALPTADQRTVGWLVTGEGGRLIPIPVQPPAAALEERELDATLADSGTLLGASVVETLHAGAAAALRGAWSLLPEPERRRFQESWLQSRFPGSRLHHYTVTGLEQTRDPVVERSALEGGWFGRRVGPLLFVTPGRVGAGLYPVPLPASSRWGLRTLPHEERVRSSVKTPPGWVPEALPDPVDVRATGIEGSAAWAFVDGTLTYTRTARVTAHHISPEDYAAFRDATRKLDAADATAVTFVPDSR